MSNAVDERVVSMRFDNADFENNAKTSLSTIEKLKQSLNFSGASKSLENISTAAGRCNLSPLSSAVEAVQLKFSSLQVFALTALTKISNAAIDAGKKIVSALTIKPIKDGFAEYETQINSVQTIMANSGKDVNTVNAALDELNEYADKTIYNFATMTHNAGMFTAAGVSLEDTMIALKGIGNWAAYAGANTQQMGNATYQLGQALSAGTIRLVDWMSIEKSAGMGGAKYREAFMETARQHGINVDAMIEKNGSFRESLRENWFTTEIFIETMKKFANDQGMVDAATKVKTFTQMVDTLKEALGTGWATSFRTIVGDFEEAKSLFTEINDVLSNMINESAKSRNKLLSDWKDLGGRTVLIDALRNSFKAISSVIKPVKEAFSEIFPPLTAEKLLKFTEGLRDLISSLTLSETAASNLKSTFKGIFSIIDILGQAASSLYNVILKPIIGVISDLGGSLLGATGSLGEWLAGLSNSIRESDIFTKSLQKIVDFLKTIGEKASTAFNSAKESVSGFAASMKESVANSGFLKSSLNLINSIIDRIRERFSKISDSAGSFREAISNAFVGIGESIGNSGFLDTLSSIWDSIKNIGSKVITALGNAFDWLSDKIGNADFSGLFDVINAASIGAVAAAILKFTKSLSNISGTFEVSVEGLKQIGEGVKSVLNGVKDCLTAYQQQIKSKTLLKIAGSIAILAASLIALSFVDSEKLAVTLGVVTGLFADLMGSMAVFNEINKKSSGVLKACATMVTISISISIMAGALKKIGELSWDQMLIGLGGLVGATGVLLGAVSLMSEKAGDIAEGAFNMILLSVAIKIMASACSDFGNMNLESLGIGLFGMAGALAAITFALNALPDNTISLGFGLIIASTALMILAGVLNKMSGMSFNEVANGLFAIGGALTVLAVGLKAMNGTAGASGSLILAAAALLILVPVFKLLGGMSWEGIAKGLVAISGSIIILAAGLYAMSGTVAGSAALIIAAAALMMLTPVIIALSCMSWEGIAKGLVALAGALAVIGIAGYALSGAIPALLALGASFALIGAGALALAASLAVAGAGLAAIASGLLALAGIGTIGATAIVAAIKIIVTGLAGLIPLVIEQIGAGLVALCGVISEGAPAIGEAFKSVLLTLVSVIVECVPQIAEGALQLIFGVLSAIAEYAPAIVEALYSILIGIIGALTAKAPELIQAVVDLLMAVLQGVTDALGKIDTSVLTEGIMGLGIIAGMLAILAAMASLVPSAMLGLLGLGLVVAELVGVLAAIGKLSEIPGLNDFVSKGGGLLIQVAGIIGSVIGSFIGAMAEGVMDHLPAIGESLSEFMASIQGFLDGANSIDASSFDGVYALIGVISALTAANLFEAITSWITGGSSFSEFADELAPLGEGLKAFSDEVSGIDIEAVSTAASAGKMLAEMAALLPNSGGLLGAIMGENDIGTFADGIVSFGTAIKGFSDAVQGIDTEAVDAAVTAGQGIADLASSLPNSGGALGWIMGENDAGSFAEGLVPLGEGLKGFSDAVQGIDTEAVDAAATVGHSIADLASSLPNSGGALGWIMGENDAGSFSEGLVPLGEGLKGFSDAVQGIDTEAIDSAVTAGQGISDLASSLPNSGGALGWIVGDNESGSFAGGLVTFGESLKSFSDSVAGIDVESISIVGESISELATSLPDLSGMNLDSLVQSFENANSELKEIASSITTDILDEIRNKNSDFNDAGAKSVDNLRNGITSGETMAISSMSAIVDGCLSVLNDSYEDFLSAGTYVVSGFAAGIIAGQSEAEAASVDMANSAYEAAKNALDINSPSKAFISLAMRVPEGFAYGIDKMKYLVNDSAVSMTDVAVNSTKKALKKIYAIKDIGDYTPTIKPVMDMSNIDVNKIKYVTAVETKLEPVKSLAQVMSESQVENTKSNMQLLTAINGLREDIALANERDDKEISLYIDSKKMASTIAKPMNKQLKVLVSRGAY